jgi:short-subunit dehydrogenase
MKVALKPLDQQTIVITGASSGIGRETAILAAKRGAKVVAVARNERALEQVVREITDLGHRAIHLVADVSLPEDMDRVANTTIETFGGFDTWVNDAGVGLYGKLEEVHLEDKRRLFDITFWGVVHGCRSALPELKRHGGALINMGSIESDVVLPLQGIYAAAKHAVKAYTDTLRLELEHDQVPVSVTLIKPMGVDTPFFQHARNYLEVEPQPSPPVYAPEVVAKAILHAATHQVRDIIIGGGGSVMRSMHYHMPSITDRYMERSQFKKQMTNHPAGGRGDILMGTDDEDGTVHGNYEGHVRKSSMYTTSRLHPLASTAALVGLGLAAFAGVRSTRL